MVALFCQVLQAILEQNGLGDQYDHRRKDNSQQQMASEHRIKLGPCGKEKKDQEELPQRLQPQGKSTAFQG